MLAKLAMTVAVCGSVRLATLPLAQEHQPGSRAPACEMTQKYTKKIKKLSKNDQKLVSQKIQKHHDHLSASLNYVADKTPGSSVPIHLRPFWPLAAKRLAVRAARKALFECPDGRETMYTKLLNIRRCH